MFMYVYVSACLCLCLYERFFICIETRYIYYKNYKLIRMWIHTSQDNLWPFFSHNNGSSFNFSFYRIGSYSVWFPIPWANAKLLSKCLPCELILHSLSALAKNTPLWLKEMAPYQKTEKQLPTVMRENNLSMMFLEDLFKLIHNDNHHQNKDNVIKD